MSKAIDAGVLLHFVTADRPGRSQRCRDLFERVRNGEESVYLPEAALCDAVRALHGVHRWPVARVAAFVGDLLALGGVRMQRKDLMWVAMDLFKETGADFVAALIAAEAAVTGTEAIYSYDRDLGRAGGGVRVVAP